MRKFFFSLSLLAVLPLSAQNNAATSSINDFAFRYFRQYERKAGENNCISPLSIGTAFAMAYAGTSGESEKEFKKVFGFGANNDSLHQSFSLLASRINGMNRTGTQISLANRIYYEKTFDFKPEFFSTVKKFYGASPDAVDFKKNYEPARKSINKWVEQQTHDRIQNLLPEGSLDAMTRMVLVNAVYMKARWASTFDSTLTYKEEFMSDDRKSKQQVNMMHQTSWYATASDKDFDVIEIPYKGDSLSMVIFLPTGKKSLAELRGNFTNEYYEKITSQLRQSGKVWLGLPKFKTSFGLTMRTDLEKMGMPVSFSDFADFSKMRSQRDIKISEAYHKTFVEVNETGTEAAAATAIVMCETTSIAPNPRQFKIDHPFIYIIREKSTGTVFFIGEMHNPNN